MSSRVRLLKISMVELHRLLDLPATTSIRDACTDPMVEGEVLLRIEDDQFQELAPGNAIPKCNAWYQTTQLTMDEAGNTVDRRSRFKAYE